MITPPEQQVTTPQDLVQWLIFIAIVALGLFVSRGLQRHFMGGRLEPVRVAREARERVRRLEQELTGQMSTEETPWQFGHLGTGLQEWVGAIEMIIYVSAVVFGKPEFIAVWFATKYVASYRTWAKEPVGRTFYNRSLFGSGLNILIGFFTGRLALWLISLASHYRIALIQK